MKILKMIYRLFVLLIFIILAGCFTATDSEEVATPLFPERHGFDLKRLTISDTDEDSISFKRLDCVWVADHEDKPSDESKVTALADMLVGIVPEEIVTQDREMHDDFNVGNYNFSYRVDLTFKDDVSFSLLLGSNIQTDAVYVRMGNRNIVYSVDEPRIRELDLDINSWLVPPEG